MQKFNNFNAYLIILNNSGDFRRPFLVRFCDMWRPVIWHLMKISWLASASCRSLLRGTFKQTFILVLINTNVTIVSYANSNSCELKLYNFLEQWIDSIIFRTMKSESTCKAAPFVTNSLILLSFIFFLKLKCQIHLDLSSR